MALLMIASAAYDGLTSSPRTREREHVEAPPPPPAKKAYEEY
jgi:hypothetical protein